VRVRLDRKATFISLLLLLSIREGGQKVLIAIKSISGESTETWRKVLADLIKRATVRVPRRRRRAGGRQNKALAAVSGTACRLLPGRGGEW
jgi:hypothetical protein